MRRFAPLLVVMATIGCGYDEDTTSSELTGAYWRGTAGVKTAGWEQSPPTVQFTDGGVSGSNGCNQFGATYELSGDRLTIEQHMTTLMYCGSPAWDVELEFSEL